MEGKGKNKSKGKERFKKMQQDGKHGSPKTCVILHENRHNPKWKCKEKCPWDVKPACKSWRNNE